jgi:Leucine-rich repeat (LRR) protein
MYKYLFLIFFVCILLLGCKSSKKDTEIISENVNEEEIITRIIDHNNYSKEHKRFEIEKNEDIEFLETISQDEISEFIEEIIIDGFGAYIYKTLDLKFLENCQQIKRLYIRSANGWKNGITNTESLKYLKNIEVLYISFCKITDISPIASLENLEKLTLWDCTEINDISPIRNLKKLKYLEIYEYKNIENIEAVFDLLSLKELYLTFDGDSGTWSRLVWENQPNLTQIKRLKNLENLKFDMMTEDILNSLTSLKQLKKLDVKHIVVDDISPLSELPKLEEVDFMHDYNRVDILPLAASNSLKEITVASNYFYDYNNLLDFLSNEGKIFSEKGISIRFPNGK